MTTETEGIVWAFPWKMGEYECPGMTLRDYFAAKAMEALILHPWHRDKEEPYAHGGSDGIARDAYTIADAMMKVRKEGV